MDFGDGMAVMNLRAIILPKKGRTLVMCALLQSRVKR
jgi:hypothetical protein